MADIFDIKTTDRRVDIKHPGTGANLGIRIGVMHIDDERLAKAKRSVTDRRLYLEARAKTFKAEEIEDNRTNILFAAITFWEWYNPTGKEGDDGYDANAAPDFHGDSNPDFNRKNVTAVLKQLPWFADQVNEALGDLQAFFDNSAQN